MVQILGSQCVRIFRENMVDLFSHENSGSQSIRMHNARRGEDGLPHQHSIYGNTDNFLRIYPNNYTRLTKFYMELRTVQVWYCNKLTIKEPETFI